ncbi:MAG TPA: hypothetical protein VK689_13250 [Armatimonadota bacterium]|nr:hypothetical protein [Armatimonadota bacterium]
MAFWNRPDPRQQYPDDLVRSVNELVALRAAGNTEQADEMTLMICARYPEEPGFHVMAAMVHRGRNRVSDAYRELLLAMALEPENPLLYQQLAVMEARQGHRSLAEAILRRGLPHLKRLFRGRQLEEIWASYCRLPDAADGERPAQAADG